VLTFTEDTTINWFAVDVMGKTSNNYDLDGNSNQYYSSKIRFR